MTVLVTSSPSLAIDSLSVEPSWLLRGLKPASGINMASLEADEQTRNTRDHLHIASLYG